MVGVTGDLNSANPFRQFDTTEAFVGGLMYDGLIRLSQKDYAPEPELAERWDVSDDQLTWTFHLRDGLTWSDGVPITAHDFVWTGNFIIEHDISSWSDGYTYTDSIVAVDDRTIVWKTTRPTLVPGLPWYNLILPEHVWGGFTVKELKGFKNFPDPVISGSFNLVEWKQGEYFRMEANPDYWARRRPIIDEIVFRVYNSNESVVQALLKGAIDYTSIPTAGVLRSRGRAAEHRDGGRQRGGLLSDVVQPLGRSAERREPGGRAIPRSGARSRTPSTRRRWSNASLAGTGRPEPRRSSRCTSSGIGSRHPMRPSRSTSQHAADCSTRPGYLDTDDDGIRESPDGGPPLELRLLHRVDRCRPASRPPPSSRAGSTSIGIDVTCTTMTDAKLYDVWLESLDWDLIIYAWGVGPDPDFILSSFTTGQCGFWSDTCYSNPRVRRALQAAADARSTMTARQAIVTRDAADHLSATRPRSCCGTRTRSRRGASDRWTGFVRWPEPDGPAFWGTCYSRGSSGPSPTQRC